MTVRLLVTGLTERERKKVRESEREKERETEIARLGMLEWLRAAACLTYRAFHTCLAGPGKYTRNVWYLLPAKAALSCLCLDSFSCLQP